MCFPTLQRHRNNQNMVQRSAAESKGETQPKAGIESIKDYTRIKTTWFNTSDKPMDVPFTMG